MNTNLMLEIILSDNENDYYYSKENHKPNETMIENAKSHCPTISEEEIKAKLGRKWKLVLQSLYPLLLYIKRFSNHNNTTLYLSQTDNYLLSIMKSSQNIGRGKDRLIRCGVLAELSEMGFVPHYLAKQYYICSENLNNLLQLCKKELKQPDSIPEYDSRETTDESSYERLINALFLKPSINAELRIDSSQLLSEDLEKALKLNYPLIDYCEKIVTLLNQHISIEEERINFRITPHYSPKGLITKIGIRATNGICHLTSLDKQIKKYERIGKQYLRDEKTNYREDYLKKRFGEYEEYDVHASVPRVARSRKTKQGFGDMNEDLYKTIFEPFVSDFSIITGSDKKGWDKDVRDFFKGFFMRLYFGGTPAQIYSALLHAENTVARKRKKEEQTLAKAEHREPSFNADDYLPFHSLVERGVDLRGMITRWKSAVKTVCGSDNTKDTSVFLYESAIYLEVREELMKRGIDCVQVYDGFYFKKGTMPNDIEQIIVNAERNYEKKCKEHRIQKSIDKLLRYGDGNILYSVEEKEEQDIKLSDFL